MFGKSEDKWIEIAFGEQKLPEGFSAKDANDIEVLKTYESLREYLQLLKDIPEMQFSNERLRDAILAAGPKASVEAPWVLRWGWAIAPIAAVLAVSAVFLKSNFTGTDTNVVVAPAGLPSSSVVASTDLVPLNSSGEGDVPKVAVKAPELNRSETVAVKSQTRASGRRKLDVRRSGVRLAMVTTSSRTKKGAEVSEATMKATATPVAASGPRGMALTQDRSDASAASEAGEITVAPATSEVSSSVILIDASSDSVTGLPNAIEVSKNSEKVSLGG